MCDGVWGDYAAVVESRAQETQYEALREEVLGQMQTLNEMIQSAEMAMPSAGGMGM